MDKAVIVDERSLVHKRENVLYVICVIVSVLTVLGFLISLFGIAVFFGLGLLTMFGHAISMAYIRMNGIELSERQFADLYERVVSLSRKMGLAEVPEVYLMESGGALNAFATRMLGFFGRTMVVLYTDVVELSINGDEDELDFVIAHELAHIKRNHIGKHGVIFLAMWIPFLGEAYSRACELTADRMAVAYTGKAEKAVRALTVFSAGKYMFRFVNKEEYLQQYNRKKGFFISLTELLSTHPAIPVRIYEIESFMGNSTVAVQKKSKSGIAIIFAGLVLVGGLFIWSAVTVIEELGKWGEELLASSSTPLLDASFNGDVEEVERLLADGVDPNEQEEEYGSTALINAAENDQLKVAKVLLENGADPNLSDVSGYSPLMAAVYMESKDMVALLVEAGGDPTQKDEGGETAISIAEDLGFKDLVKIMKKASR